MTYSTIIVKKKQLKCGCYDYNFSKSRCKKHATLEDTANRIIKYRHENIKEDKEQLWDWFKERRKEMKGICSNCNNPSSKKADKEFICSALIIISVAITSDSPCHRSQRLFLSAKNNNNPILNTPIVCHSKL